MSNKRLTNEERAEIYRLWKEEGLTYKVIAERCSVNIATVGNVVKKMNAVQGMLDTLSASGKPLKSQINKEFDDAVNDMIAESKAQFNDDFEDTITESHEEIEQVAEPATVTEEHTVEAVPDAVMQAIIDKIVKLSDTLSDNLMTVKKIQQENEQIRYELAVLYGWRAEHEGAEN